MELEVVGVVAAAAVMHRFDLNLNTGYLDSSLVTPTLFFYRWRFRWRRWWGWRRGAWSLKFKFHRVCVV